MDETIGHTVGVLLCCSAYSFGSNPTSSHLTSKSEEALPSGISFRVSYTDALEMTALFAFTSVPFRRSLPQQLCRSPSALAPHGR